MQTDSLWEIFVRTRLLQISKIFLTCKLNGLQYDSSQMNVFFCDFFYDNKSMKSIDWCWKCKKHYTEQYILTRNCCFFKHYFLTCTEPDPPTNVRCPDSPLDVSLHISWEAPTNSNGIIQHYMIIIPSRDPDIILTSSNVTNKNVDGLHQGMMLYIILCTCTKCNTCIYIRIVFPN